MSASEVRREEQSCFCNYHSHIKPGDQQSPSFLMRQVHPVLGLLVILLRELLHLNTLLSHRSLFLSDNFRERIVFYGVSNTVHPEVSFLLACCRHPEVKFVSSLNIQTFPAEIERQLSHD